MNNKVIFAAAGHGKTYSLCKQAKQSIKYGNKQTLLIAYTNEGVRALENEYKKQNNGVLPDKVIFKTWYSFLLSDFIKPYQCSLRLYKKNYNEEEPFYFPENYISSFAFYDTRNQHKWYKTQHVQYFINNNCDVIPDKASHLAYLCNEHSKKKAIKRMEEVYSHIFIDELQDYAGWDLEIISLLFSSKIIITCVGDYKQATYRTNNSQKNKQYRDHRIINYFTMLEKKGACNVSYVNTTRRFNSEICDFVNTIYNDAKTKITPDISIKNTLKSENSGVYIIDTKYLKEYCNYYKPTVLRYNKNVPIHFTNSCNFFTYGNSKGATYDRVIIIPVGTVIPFITKQKEINAIQTKAKFYVACTRAKYSIVFAMEDIKENNIFTPTKIYFDNKNIPAYKFKPIL